MKSSRSYVLFNQGLLWSIMLRVSDSPSLSVMAFAMAIIAYIRSAYYALEDQ